MRSPSTLSPSVKASLLVAMDTDAFAPLKALNRGNVLPYCYLTTSLLDLLSLGLPPPLPERKHRAFTVHHLAGVTIDQDEHRLPLVRVLHEPDGHMKELAVVRGRIGLDRLKVVHARLCLPFGELVRERPGLGLRVRLGCVPTLDLDPARLTLVEAHLALQLELEPLLRLVLRVPADRDERDVLLELDAVMHRYGLGHLHLLRTPLDGLRHVLRPREVRNDGGRDDPVGHVLEYDLAEFGALRYL